MVAKVSFDEFVNRSRKIHGGKYEYKKESYQGSNKKIEIFCKEHGWFWQKSYNHSIGEGCMKCSRKKQSIRQSKTIEDFLKDANRVHKNRYDYSKVNYKNYNTKIEIICKIHGEFWQSPMVHINSKSGCKLCGREKTIKAREVNFENFLRRAKLIHGKKFIYHKKSFVNMKIKIEIECKKHGIFLMQPSIHVAKRKPQGCKKCGIEKNADNKRTPINIFIKKANAIHSNKYNYSKVNYKNVNDKIEIICLSHGSFFQTMKDHIFSMAGCPRCAKQKQSKDQTMTFEKFVEKSINYHGSKYYYHKDHFFTAMKLTKITCHNHGDFWQTPNAHYFGQGCPRCTHTVSKQETEWLDSLNIPQENRNCKLPKLGRYKVDGWMKNESGVTVYEFNGSYWHGDPRVFDHKDYNKVTKCTFGDLYKKTMKKAAAIAAAGYQLITMWEEDYNILEAKVANSDLSPLVKVT